MANRWWGGCLHQKLECVLSWNSERAIDMLLLGLQFIDGRSNDLPGDSLIGIYFEVYPDNQRIPITPCCASLGELSCWCRKLTCHKPGWDWLHKELWELHHFAEYILPKAEAGEIAPGWTRPM